MSIRALTGLVLLVLAVVWTAARADEPAVETGTTLLGTIVQWRYPGADILLDGSTQMSDAKTPGVESARLQTILTTPDSVEEVAKFYTDKLKTLPVPVPAETKAEAKRAGAKSVFEQDDSKGRPVQIRVFAVNQADMVTTLVISRADGEDKTHIAWSQYIRFPAKP